jgi:multicomponent Na+:H+ antiporter subunit G
MTLDSLALRSLLSAALLLAGVAFLAAGTVGLLRFPDVYTRLHALTKADNLGLGLIVLGLALRSGSLAVALELALVWSFLMAASATTCSLIAGAAFRDGVVPWRRPR